MYAGLDHTAPGWLGRPMLVLGTALALAGMRTAGRRVTRTAYRPSRWRWPEVVVAGSGVVVAFSGWWMSRHELLIAYPAVTVMPTLSLVALAGALAGVAGALCAPPTVVRPAVLTPEVAS